MPPVAPITDYQTFLRHMGASYDALRAFMNGKADAGLARFLIGSRAARIAGKAFLPLTVVTGAFDAVTGWDRTVRAAGRPEASGSLAPRAVGALLASSAGLIALGPVGVGIAGAAVLGYGAWTLGNYVYDHWDDITAFGGAAKERR